MSFTLEREAEIVKVVVSHGWDYFHHRISQLSQTQSQSEHPYLPLPTVLCQILIDLGPTFIKLGQVLSTRPDLLAPEYIHALETLQSNVPAMPWECIKPTLETEFDRPLTEIFADIEETAIAAGSLAQVHRGRLLSGKVVALKIQRPGIRQVIEADLEGLQSFVKYFSKGKLGEAYDLQALLDEFRISILGELDFLKEAHNTHELGKNLANSTLWPEGKIKVPKVYAAITTERVLVLEWIPGKELLKANIPKETKVKIAEWVAQLMLKQVFLDSFFHADPHPGNFFYLTNEHANEHANEYANEAAYQIVLLDCGMVSHLDPRTQDILLDLFIGVINEKPRQISQAVRRLGYSKYPVDMQILEAEFDRLLRRFYTRPLAEIKFTELLNDILRVPRENHIQLPGAVGLLIKALTNVEGVARTLDPQFPFVEVARPVIEKALRKQLISKELLRRASTSLYTLRNLPDVPQRLGSLLNRLERTELGLNLSWRDQANFQQLLRQSIRQLSVAILAVGAILSGAILIAAESNASSSLSFGLEIIWGNALLLGGLALAGWFVLVSIINQS